MGERLAGDIQCKQNFIYDIFSQIHSVHHPSLFLNGTIIEETTSNTHLSGLTFSSTCTWTDHVNYISEKAWTILNFLRALKFRTREKYIYYIRPLLEYSDSVWDKCSSHSKKQLEAIHTEAARIIVGAIKLCAQYRETPY